MMKGLLLFMAALSATAVSSGAGQAFPMTDVGVFELKTLPAGRVIESEGDGSYFDRSNNLFMPLFRYISRNDISMTTPVEARIYPGKMVFWIDETEKEKAAASSDKVRVVDLATRSVASAGFRGAYSQSNFDAGKSALLDWVDSQPELKVAGEPYAVFWNGPMSLPFLKRFEVHVVVTAEEAK